MWIESLLQDWGLRWPQTMKEVKDNQLRDLRSKIRTCYGESATPSGQKRHPQTWPWWCFPSISHLWLSWWVAMRLQWQNAPGCPRTSSRGQDWNNLALLFHLHLTRDSGIFSRISPFCFPLIPFNSFWLCWMRLSAYLWEWGGLYLTSAKGAGEYLSSRHY